MTDVKRVPFGRAYRLNRDYFVQRFKLLGEQKFIDFVRDEAKGWEAQGDVRNLEIAKKTYNDLTGKDLPAISDSDLITELRRENEKLRQAKIETEPVEDHWTNDQIELVDIEDQPVEGAHSISGSLKKGKGRSKNVGS